MTCWHGYLLQRSANYLAYGSADVTATQSSLLQLNPEWFNHLVPIYPGCRGKRSLNECGSSSTITTTTTAILRPFVRDYPGDSVPEG